ncbi:MULTISPECIES: hypothetical protein [Salarchaeum]|uniref:Antitoxin VbhA domain-containing protein n=1 Tax=Salarchaeum japonicum TaxID=555573 RepID=A0AAV3SXN0_9EURY|nr:hypothetical protein [Salarchaeum japonicum]
MSTDVSERVREIARYNEENESAVIQQAVEKGVDDLWRDVVISKYLTGEISREEAVDELGADIVRDVDTAASAIEDDVSWGLSNEG